MILELSQYNSQQVIGNGEWVNNFSPITLQPGDSITVNQAFIDAQLSGDYNNIAIPEDLTLTLTNGFFYMNLVDGDIKPGPVAANPYDLFLVRFQTHPFPIITDTHTVVLPKGNYSPNAIAQTITSQLTSIPHISIQDFNNMSNMFLKTSAGYPYSLSCKGFDMWSNELTSLQATVVPIPAALFQALTATPTFTITAADTYGGNYKFPNIPCNLNQATGVITFAPIPIHGYGQTMKDIVCTAIGGVTYLFSQTDTGVYFNFTTNRWIGATQIALEYDVNQNGKFQWTYMHMPMYQNNDEGINVVKDGNGIMRFADVRSGIFWTDLQPASFWESLGFDLSSVLVRDGGPLGHPVLQTPLTRGVNITSAYTGLDAFIASSRTLPVVPDATYFYATSQTNPIVAPNNYTGTDVGFYLIEVSGLHTDYQDDNKAYSAIMSVSSKNYDQNGLITVYGDGSIPFINNGDPLTISTLHIRILDPITKQPATLLGQRNSVFLNIQRANPTE